MSSRDCVPCLKCLHKTCYILNEPIEATLEYFLTFQLTLSEILRPAAELAETGFPVQKLAANSWRKGLCLHIDPDMATHFILLPSCCGFINFGKGQHEL